MTKTEELLALADIVDPLVTECESYEGKIKAAAALREYAGMLGTVQKLRPDFLAGYDAGMKDMAHMIDAKIAEQPLAEPVAWRYRWPATAQYLSTNWEYASTPEKPRLLEPSNGDRCELQPLYTHPPAPTQREHITDGSPCWCSPDLDYVDPETGAKVWIHKNIQ